MTLAALQHLIRAASALAGDRKFLVLGSASLLASFPELGEASSPLAATYDADLCPEPFDELTGLMLEEALGENRAYFRRHGYHADWIVFRLLGEDQAVAHLQHAEGEGRADGEVRADQRDGHRAGRNPYCRHNP